MRRDPFAMLPFCGYHMGDYFAHWLKIGASGQPRKAAAHLLRQLVPQGRRRQIPLAGLRREQPRAEVDLRARRRQGQAVETPIGRLPAPGALDLAGLDLPAENMREVLRVDPAEWRNEVPSIREHYGSLGAQLPAALRAELDALEKQLS